MLAGAETAYQTHTIYGNLTCVICLPKKLSGLENHTKELQRKQETNKKLLLIFFFNDFVSASEVDINASALADCVKVSGIVVIWILITEAKYNHLFLCFPPFGYRNLVFQLDYYCFIMLCQFLLYNNVNQLYVYIYLLPLEPPCHTPPSHPSRSSQSTRLSSLCYAATSHYLFYTKQ